ncbi:MAG TPA: AI-2E family transporter [Gaiellales bacterium]|nr:AI-2E family transporter [Gaiellales bacterium]
MVIDVPTRTVVRVIGLVIVAAAAVKMIGAVSHVLTWVAVSLFLAVALEPVVRVAERWMSRTWAVLAVFSGLLVLIALFLAVLIIPIATQVDDLRDAAPGYLQKLERNQTIRDLNQRYQLVAKAQDAAKQAPARVFGAAGRFVSGVVATITVLFLTLFLLFELPAMSQGVLSMLPPERADRVRRVSADVNRSVGGYVLGNLAISIIAGTVIGISLWILSVPYAAALAVLMGVFDLVPLVGATVGALAAIGVAFATQGVTAGIVMIVVNVVYQQVENHILQPLVYRRTVQLSAFLVLVAVLVGGELMGVLGALVAIPVAGSIQLIVRELRQESRAAEPQPETASSHEPPGLTSQA